MERLTYKNYIEEYEVNFEKSSDKNWSIAESDTHIKVTGEPIEKLGELEDVLERWHIKDLEEYISILNEARNFAIKERNTMFRKYIKETIRSEELETILAELKQKAIVPKFKIGQEVWWIDTGLNSFNEQGYRIESYLIDSIVITKEQFRYYGDDGLWLGDNELFATEEEAEQKLAEIRGKDE